MGLGEYLAHIYEAGSVTKTGANADPRMLRYGASFYPENVGIELVVLDLEDFRQSCKLAEPRLAIELDELCINLDLALQTKSSESGRRIFDSAFNIPDRGMYKVEGSGQDQQIDQGNYYVSKNSMNDPSKM